MPQAGPAERAVRDALARIAERDPVVRAWLHVDADGALARARALDGEGDPRGPLHGVPIGVKDVFDTVDMPTTCNSPLFSGHRPGQDAACVATLRAAGAIVLGKTDTTEFAAAGRNAATANPHDPTRTPGGSSAGAAAAVSDGHVRVAIATQTGGSTIRPASFCGIHGFKPTWAAVSREGMKTYAISLDTVGWHARGIDDLDRLADVFALAPPPPRAPGPLRIAVCRTPYWDRMDDDGATAFDGIAAALGAGGAIVEPLDLPASFDALEDDFRAILYREGGAAFLDLARARPALLHADFHERVASRARYDDRALRDAYDRTAATRATFEALAARYDAVLAPSAPGIAPTGRAPGNPIFNQLWTMLHGPVVTLPLARGAHDMPIGVSLVAARFEDRRLLSVARMVETLLAGEGIVPTCRI